MKRKVYFPFEFCSFNRIFDFAEDTFARQNKLKQVLFAFVLAYSYFGVAEGTLVRKIANKFAFSLT